MIDKILDAIGGILFPQPKPRPIPVRVKDRR